MNSPASNPTLSRSPAWFRAVLPVMGALLICWPGSVRSELTLAEGGKSAYRIVVDSKAIPAERYAAEELQSYLERITGARLPLVSDTDPEAPAEIVLGDNARLRKAAPDSLSRLQGLGPDGFLLQTVGERLVIAGGKPRGTLNGVYTLLEETLKVRWFTPELDRVPRQPLLKLQSLNVRHVPALENRDVFWREMMRDADFAARHRLNGQHYGLKDKHGGAFTRYHPFVHSFDGLVPPELFKDHPEYFPIINGQRKGGYVQRCLSNPDVLKLSVARVRQWIKEHPTANIISVSQNDCINNCQCGPCEALDDAEGSPAATLLKFVNAIASDLEQDHPNVRLDTLAYQYTRKPPKTIRPHRNVIVRLCSIECCFAHPLDTCPATENVRFREDIIAWQPVAPLLYVWDYTPNFAHYQQPFPNFDALQANVKFFVQHGVKSLFEQGNYSGGGYGEMGPLRAYVLAKLLWNPETDVARHVREFTDAYYGQAAPKIRDYVEWMQQQVRGTNIHAHIFDSPKAAYLNDEFLTAAGKLFDQAEDAAENDTVRFRVQLTRLPIWYLELVRNRVTGEPRKEMLARFLGVARKAGISNISEGQALNDWAKKMGAP